MRIVYYDLQTTNLTPTSGRYGVQIVSIGAKSKDPVTKSFDIFHEHIVPTVVISGSASQKHGLTRKKLLKMERCGDASEPGEGLLNFITFLEGLQRFPTEKILLVSIIY